MLAEEFVRRTQHARYLHRHTAAMLTVLQDDPAMTIDGPVFCDPQIDVQIFATSDERLIKAADLRQSVAPEHGRAGRPDVIALEEGAVMLLFDDRMGRRRQRRARMVNEFAEAIDKGAFGLRA